MINLFASLLFLFSQISANIESKKTLYILDQMAFLFLLKKFYLLKTKVLFAKPLELSLLLCYSQFYFPV